MPHIDTNTLPAIGDPFEGGFFGGRVRLSAGIFALAWAPKASQIIGAIGITTVPGMACDYADSRANTEALAAAGSPLAQAALGADINGHKDWLLPARDVLELGYRLLKPTVADNFASWRDGENHNSVPPGHHYSAYSPKKTEVANFQRGAAEAFDTAWYLSSTVHSPGRAFGQNFYGGGQNSYYVSFEARARFVRLIQLSA